MQSKLEDATCARCSHRMTEHHPKFGMCLARDTSGLICQCPRFTWAPVDEWSTLKPPDFTVKTDPSGFIQSANMPELTVHHSEGKVGVDQLDVDFLSEMALVLDFGAKKYERDNWKKGTAWHEFYGSTLRHLWQFWRGHSEDAESGCLHLAHAAVNIMFLYYYWRHGKGTDDRP